MYNVPEEFHYRLHHVRPRFKNNVENVLIYVASALSSLNELPKNDFNAQLNEMIWSFPGNATLTKKTVNNWRTEISALFGFISPGTAKGTLRASQRAIELSDQQDLVAAFKKFLFFFQYPGGHIKPERTLEDMQAGVHFKPTQYILKLLTFAEQTESKANNANTRVPINKAEATHMLFNDLRITRDNEDIATTWQRIKYNKEYNVEYDWTGDVIRYAGDILDYMVLADLLVTYDNKNFYLNKRNIATIDKFIKSTSWFDGYDSDIDIDIVKEQQLYWFEYVNQAVDETTFETDIVSLISSSEEEYEALKAETEELFHSKLESGDDVTTKEIGDMGEALIHGHECMRIKLAGREDLIHLINKIPTYLAIGYDIASVEEDASKRLIEVKTTVSSSKLSFNRFHLTDNEWNAANSYGDRYFVYRLFLSKENKTLLLMQNPVKLFKEDKINVAMKNGVEISFKTDDCCNYEDLLIWER